jgi:hypothetical protein
MLAGSSVLAAVTWGIQTIGGDDYSRELPALLETVANSGGHPLFGVVGASIGRQADRLLDRGSRLKAATIGWAATFLIDVAAEETQDILLYPHDQPFYAASHIGENITDLKFALGGFGLAVLVNNRDRFPLFADRPAAEQDAE